MIGQAFSTLHAGADGRIAAVATGAVVLDRACAAYPRRKRTPLFIPMQALRAAGNEALARIRPSD